MKLIRRLLGALILFLDRVFTPKGMVRREAEQQKVELQTQAMALYQLPACPFCVKVRRAMKRLSLDIELRNVAGDNQWRSELLREGGKMQVPCLKIEQPGESAVWMYESGEIVNYLTQRFAGGSAQGAHQGSPQ